MNRLDEPYFVTRAEIEVLHHLSLRKYGGLAGVRDEGMLDSALAQARATFGGVWLHSFPSGMAAAYAYSVTKNHPYLDGNKRAAWAAARHFLWREGFALYVTDEEAIETMLGVADGRIGKDELTAWIAARITRGARLELRNFLSDLNVTEFVDRIAAITNSYRSGGPAELDAIMNDTARAIPAVEALTNLYIANNEANVALLHFVQVFAALYRIAEDHGYEW